MLFCRGFPPTRVVFFFGGSVQLRSNGPNFRWRRVRPKASARPVRPLETLLRLPLPLLPSPLRPRLPLDCLPPKARDQRPDRPPPLSPMGPPRCARSVTSPTIAASHAPPTCRAPEPTAHPRVPKPQSMRRTSSARELRLCRQSSTWHASAYMTSSFQRQILPSPAPIDLPTPAELSSPSCHPCRHRLCSALVCSPSPVASQRSSPRCPFRPVRQGCPASWPRLRRQFWRVACCALQVPLGCGLLCTRHNAFA